MFKIVEKSIWNRLCVFLERCDYIFNELVAELEEGEQKQCFTNLLCFLTEAIPLYNNNCTIYYISSVHNNINIVI